MAQDDFGIGDAGQRFIPDFLHHLVLHRATGTLMASCHSGERQILLVDGEVRAARSNLEQEMLGFWLVDRGHLDEQNRAQALFAQASQNTHPLGHILVSRDLIEPDLLIEELEALTLQIIRLAVEDSTGQNEFLSDPSLDHLDTLPRLTTTQILLEASRALTNLQAKKESLGDFNQVISQENALDGLLEDLSLSPKEAFLLSRLDGTRSLFSLLRVASMPEEEAVSTLYNLAMAQLVKIGPPLHPILSDRAAEPRNKEPILEVDEQNLGLKQVEERDEIKRLASQVATLDHYQSLGLNKNASAADIQQQWALIRQRYAHSRTSEHHLRDLGPQINTIRERAHAAYQVLGKAPRRKRYDRIIDEVQEDERRLAGEGRARETDAGARSILVSANLQRADELIREGEIHLAIRLLEQACAIEPRPDALTKLAQLMLRNPSWHDRALKLIRRAINVDPKYNGAWLELAEFWRRRGDAERQRKALERILSTDPDHERANKMYRQIAGPQPLKRFLDLSRLTRR